MGVNLILSQTSTFLKLSAVAEVEGEKNDKKQWRNEGEAWFIQPYQSNTTRC